MTLSGHSNNKGFTLTELMITVAIIGILAGIAVPLFLGQRTKAAQTEAITNLESIRLLEEQYFSENGSYRQVGGVATDGTLNYTTSGGAVTDGGIQTLLPNFRPGVNLLFNYQLFVETRTTAADSFRASATGKAGTIVEGNIFWINYRNEKSW
ncbi:MAG: prepilin-type N-terminal cleavage/methylation domain-containing protein [Nitrospirae bacterium]|nr:prepilin-type N-terminal cleavage/methylation domain-containing protein [Nitrospirota bacterium]